MIHGNKLRKFNRTKKQRSALLASLVRALVLAQKIETTEMKAKSLRPVVEKLVTLGKKKTLASRRLLVARVGEDAAKEIVDVLVPKYETRAGGYTRIIKLGTRPSDRAAMAVIEFV